MARAFEARLALLCDAREGREEPAATGAALVLQATATAAVRPGADAAVLPRADAAVLPSACARLIALSAPVLWRRRNNGFVPRHYASWTVRTVEGDHLDLPRHHSAATAALMLPQRPADPGRPA